METFFPGFKRLFGEVVYAKRLERLGNKVYNPNEAKKNDNTVRMGYRRHGHRWSGYGGRGESNPRLPEIVRSVSHAVRRSKARWSADV